MAQVQGELQKSKPEEAQQFRQIQLMQCLMMDGTGSRWLQEIDVSQRCLKQYAVYTFGKMVKIALIKESKHRIGLAGLWPRLVTNLLRVIHLHFAWVWFNRSIRSTKLNGWFMWKVVPAGSGLSRPSPRCCYKHNIHCDTHTHIHTHTHITHTHTGWLTRLLS
jgi:hypothetical protein